MTCTRPWLEIPDDRFDAVYDEILTVNLKSPLLTARAALGPLRQRHGCLILTCSSSSFYAGRGGPLYVASKFAIRGVVDRPGPRDGTRRSGQRRGARAAPSAPTWPDRGASDGPESGSTSGRDGRKNWPARTPLHLALTAADHAGAYLFLASDAAAGITGEIIRSDGGLGVR